GTWRHSGRCIRGRRILLAPELGAGPRAAAAGLDPHRGARGLLRRRAARLLARERDRVGADARLRLRRHGHQARGRSGAVRRGGSRRRAGGAGAAERAGALHLGRLHPLAALALRPPLLRHRHVPGFGGQARRDHAGQQPPALLPGGRPPRRHRPRTHRLDEHRCFGHGSAADRPARGRRALLLHPPLLPEQGGAPRGRGDRGAALRGDGLRHLRRFPGRHRRHDRKEPGLGATLLARRAAELRVVQRQPGRGLPPARAAQPRGRAGRLRRQLARHHGLRFQRPPAAHRPRPLRRGAPRLHLARGGGKPATSGGVGPDTGDRHQPAAM
ncbi:MAG: Hydroxymethylpyrimidine ABC transporter, substrate-binding component, partial [uncultured Acetobacteraceae bacterium]